MAKPLSKKSQIIRAAIKNHSYETPKEIADLLNDAQDRLDDKLEFMPIDISQQKQALKHMAGAQAETPEPEAGPKAQPEAAESVQPPKLSRSFRKPNPPTPNPSAVGRRRRSGAIRGARNRPRFLPPRA